jgi:hypothetical protein
MIRITLVLLFAITPAMPIRADDFVCPVQPEAGTTATDTAKALDLSGGSDPLDAAERIGTAVEMLRNKGLPPSLIVDAVMASYCPRVAATGLPMSQKIALMQSFAARVTRSVYAPADGDEVAVLVDIPLPPDLEKQAAAAAKREGLSVPEWVVESARRRLQEN